MAELICAFEESRLPADANLQPIPDLLTGQIALHHCLDQSFRHYIRTWMRMSTFAFTIEATVQITLKIAAECKLNF